MRRWRVEELGGRIEPGANPDGTPNPASRRAGEEQVVAVVHRMVASRAGLVAENLLLVEVLPSV